MSEKAVLKYGGQEYELPVISGSEGETAIDVRNLRKQSGLVTFDPGYGNTGSCRSSVTFIDGEKGILRYRGVPIEEIAERSTFLETAFLLIKGRFPTKPELDEFVSEITQHTMLHENAKRFYDGFPRKSHPMAVSAAMVAALSALYPERLDPTADGALDGVIVRLLAKLPTIVAYAFKHSVGQPFMYPDNRLDYASNFLRMMFAIPCEKYEVDPVIAKALDLLLILHADHEQNCSTSTVRLVGSSQSNLFASISAGIGALWGPLHGGANQKVVEMLESIADGEGSAEKFVEKAKSKDDTTRLMGFGHRVYKNYDPRARVIKKLAHEVFKVTGRNPLIDIALELETIALNDPFFVERKLYPNVDFYSGLIYQSMGFPTTMFPVLFAIPRAAGWLAQWQEMLTDKEQRIARPRQIYIGHGERNYVPLDQRGAQAAT